MWDSIQPANSLQQGSGDAELNLELAPSLLAAAGLGSSPAGLPHLPGGSLAGLGDWLGSFKARQGHNGLAGLHSMSLELPAVLLQGANSLDIQDAATIKDTVGNAADGDKGAAAVKPADLAAGCEDAGSVDAETTTAGKRTALDQAAGVNV
jgi:hypothetical protein